MEYVIGIDGGGTKTILRACSLDGQLMIELEGGSANIHSSSSDAVAEVIYSILDKAIAAKGLKKEDCAYLCMGAAGVDRESERKLFEKLLQSYGLACPCYIANDAEVMLAAGAGKPEGIVVIAGTGSIAYGRNCKGDTFRAGGWGHLIGDEGSGYWIAKEAINAAVRCYDKRAEETMLLDLLMKKLDLKEAWDFIEYVYSSGKGKSDIAALAKVVQDAYQAGDRIAGNILANASRELFLMCHAVVKELDFTEQDFDIVAGGGVFAHNDFVYEGFCRVVSEQYPRARIARPSESAAKGAVDIAFHMLHK